MGKLYTTWYEDPLEALCAGLTFATGKKVLLRTRENPNGTEHYQIVIETKSKEEENENNININNSNT